MKLQRLDFKQVKWPNGHIKNAKNVIRGGVEMPYHHY